MKKILGVLFFVFVFVNVSSQSTQHLSICRDVSLLGLDAQRMSRIDALLSGYVADGLLPNAVGMIVKDGQVVYQGAYGYSDMEAKKEVSSSDFFRMASQTKAITSVLLMTFFEENKFLLDDPIEKYLPQLASPQVYVSGSVSEGNLITAPATRSITIRNLMSHTSGYGYDPFGQELEGFAYRKPATSSKDLLDRFAKVPLLHQPGERFTYGFSTDILGLLAEVIGGKPLDILMKERIFDPLGMENTFFTIPKEKREKLVKLYFRENDLLPCKSHPDPFAQDYPKIEGKKSFCGGGGLSGTIEDYAKFCQMILNGGEFNNHRILSSQTVKLLGTNQVENIPNNHPFSLAFELTDFSRYNRSMVPINSWKWGGAFGTDYLIDFENNMILLFYTNTHQTSNTRIHDSFHISVYQSLK